MRKEYLTFIGAVLFIGTVLVSLAFAQEMNGMMGKDMVKSDKMAQKEMMGKCAMHGRMMPGMMAKSLTATADGGVIVSVGNKLIKYDKDLNVVKEVEIKIDMEGLRKHRMGMMKDCPYAGEENEEAEDVE
ncbi:MAG: hypothetical protein HQL23_07555 [Candidatus Omnitrophica bacterium]|nr:hypothetical protein [Candidatus Omnitrophota bacterium]